MPRTVYWDACVFHALFSSEKDRVDDCLRIEKAAGQGDVLIYTSTATFVECVWVKTITDPTGNLYKLSPTHEQVIQGYFSRTYIRPINCDRQIAEAARSLLWQYSGLKPKDAIHVASAISQGVDVLHSYDKDLLKLDGKIGSPGMKVCIPGHGDGFDPQLAQTNLVS